jgi:hypothetical protein
MACGRVLVEAPNQELDELPRASGQRSARRVERVHGPIRHDELIEDRLQSTRTNVIGHEVRGQVRDPQAGQRRFAQRQDAVRLERTADADARGLAGVGSEPPRNGSPLSVLALFDGAAPT